MWAVHDALSRSLLSGGHSSQQGHFSCTHRVTCRPATRLDILSLESIICELFHGRNRQEELPDGSLALCRVLRAFQGPALVPSLRERPDGICGLPLTLRKGVSILLGKIHGRMCPVSAYMVRRGTGGARSSPSRMAAPSRV